jgi:hypothetical protein
MYMPEEEKNVSILLYVDYMDANFPEIVVVDPVEVLGQVALAVVAEELVVA